MSRTKTLYLFTNGKPFKPPVKIEAEFEKIQKYIQEKEGRLWYECQNLYDPKGNVVKKMGKIKNNEVLVVVPPDCKFTPGKYKQFYNNYIKGISNDLLDAETYCNRMATPRLKVVLQKTPRCQEFIPKSVAAPKDIAITECTPRTPHSGTKSKKTSCFNTKKKLPKYPALRTKKKKVVCPKTLKGGNMCPNSGRRKKKSNLCLNCCKKRPATYRKPYIPRNKRTTPRNVVKNESARKSKKSKKSKGWFSWWPFCKKKSPPRHVYCDLDCKENRLMKKRFTTTKKVQTDNEELISPTAKNEETEKGSGTQQSEIKKEKQPEIKKEKPSENSKNPVKLEKEKERDEGGADSPTT